MNEHIRTRGTGRVARPSTQAAEGLPRWRWTTDDVLRLVELGILDAHERIELLGGEIVPMSPTGRRHEVIAEELHQYWIALHVADVRISKEVQFNLDEATYTEPDLLVRPPTIKSYDLKGHEALLVVEVADTSLVKDSTFKARIYASFGVREYWVIDAKTLETRVHTGPTNQNGFACMTTVLPDRNLTPHLVPALALRLADLDLV